MCRTGLNPLELAKTRIQLGVGAGERMKEKEVGGGGEIGEAWRSAEREKEEEEEGEGESAPVADAKAWVTATCAEAGNEDGWTTNLAGEGAAAQAPPSTMAVLSGIVESDGLGALSQGLDATFLASCVFGR